MRVSLVYNPTAGGRQDVRDLVALLTEAGHRVRHRSSKGNWQRLLQDPDDVLVAAGGDGTVRKVALAAADHGVPFAVLPFGTANNVAKTLEIMGDARRAIARWDGRRRPFDVAEVHAEADDRFIEAAGGGLFANLIVRADEVIESASVMGRETDRALHLLGELVASERPHHWAVRIDGRDCSGDYLAVEVLNIRFAGPNVPIAPLADPGDGWLDVVLIGDEDRQALTAYVDDRLRLASGAPPRLRIERGSRVELGVPAGVAFRVDDRLWGRKKLGSAPVGVTISVIPRAAEVLGAGTAGDR